VPKDLEEHYPKPFIEISLRQTDRSVAAAICQETHLLVEEQFKRLRQGLPRDRVTYNRTEGYNNRLKQHNKWLLKVNN